MTEAGEKDMRYEVKFAVDILDVESIRASLLMHPASFRKAYEDRQVNNIYLDSPSFHCFHQNIEGHPQRKKMRLRWYGNSEWPTKKSTLEIKNKNAELGWKDSFKVDASNVRDTFTLLEVIASSGYYQGNLIPTLHNNYKRSYYESQDGLFRITLDSEQTFKIPFTKMQCLPTINYPVIIELKYNQENSGKAKFITDYLAFRQTKNSKYTVGVQSLYF